MKQKFRPSLTAAEVTHVITLCKRDGSQLSLSVARQLSIFQAKIDNGLVQHSHTVKPTLAEEVGFVQSNEPAEMTPEEAYTNWRINPAALTLKQLQLAADYRYENDLMTEDEESRYEKIKFGM